MNRRSFLRTIAGALASLVPSCNRLALAARRPLTPAPAPESLTVLAVPAAFEVGTVEGPLASFPAAYVVSLPGDRHVIATNLAELPGRPGDPVPRGTPAMVYRFGDRFVFDSAAVNAGVWVGA